MPRTKPYKPGLTERQVLDGCLDALRAFGIDCQRQNTGAAMGASGKLVRFGKRGDSDLSGMLPDGRKLDIEVKRPGKRPTSEQLDRLHRTNAQGGVGMWVDDPKQLAETLPKLLDGWRIEIDERGMPWRVAPD